MGWRDEQRERDAAMLEEIRHCRAMIEDLTPTVGLSEVPEPAQRPLSRFPGLALSVRLCRDHESGASLLRMLKPVPKEYRSGTHGLTVHCVCKSATRVTDTLRPCVGDCGRWFVGDESGVWAVMLPEPAPA